MNWARKGFVQLLSVLLFVSLVGVAFSASSNLAFSHPAKIEGWLKQSGFYDHFVSNATAQAKKSAGSNVDQGSVTLSDTAVQQAADTAFSPAVLQDAVSQFLDGNYAWLQGKTPQPSFTIDLTKSKQNFASQIGQYVQSHIASLPVCTPEQLAALGRVSDVDPLNITCRPPNLTAQAEASLVTQRINSSGNFLPNPVISANNINPNGGDQSQPYYQKFSQAPKLYQLAVKLPLIYGVVALLSAIGIIFIAARKRRGLRRVGIVLVLAGVVLVITKFIADAVLTKVEKKVFNNASIGQLQQSLTNFLHRAVNQWASINLWFGIGFLVLAAVIFIILRQTRGRGLRPAAPLPINDGSALQNETPAQLDTTPRPRPTGPPPTPKRPPRLIQ